VFLGDTNPVPAKGPHQVFVTFVDNPEQPVVFAGDALIL
jgi:hypothetical protein